MTLLGLAPALYAEQSNLKLKDFKFRNSKLFDLLTKIFSEWSKIYIGSANKTNGQHQFTL